MFAICREVEVTTKARIITTVIETATPRYSRVIIFNLIYEYDNDLIF